MVFLNQLTKDSWDNWMIKPEFENSKLNKFILKQCPTESYNDFIYNVIGEAIASYERGNDLFLENIGYHTDYDVDSLLTHFNDHHEVYLQLEKKGFLKSCSYTLDRIQLARRIQIEHLWEATKNFLDQEHEHILKLYEVETRNFCYRVFAKNKAEFVKHFRDVWETKMGLNFAEDLFDSLVKEVNVIVVGDGFVYRDYDLVRGEDVR